MREASPDLIAEYIKNNGRRASNSLSLLGKILPFVQAMKSDIGQEILKDDIDRHEELLTKMYEENITPQELAEFRYLKARIKKVSARIENYNSGVKEILESKKSA